MKTRTLIFILLILASCSRYPDEPVLHIPVAQLTPENAPTDLPIVDITAEPEDIADMFADYEEDIEVEALFSLYRQGTNVIVDLPVEIEVKGNYSAQFPLKSLGIKFADEYDNTDGSLINPSRVLPYHSLEKIKAVRLRNSGNDFYGTMLKDLSYARLAVESGLDLDLTYGEPVLTFLNGEFYGLLNLRTEANANGMSALYQANKDDLTLCKMQNPHLYHKDGDWARTDALQRAVQRGDTEYLKAVLDLENMRDYFVFQTYIGNADWPFNNVRLCAVDDGKFRFTLFDLDHAAAKHLTRPPLQFITEAKENLMSDLFMLLYADDVFREDFDNRYRQVIAENKISVRRFAKIVNANTQRIEHAVTWQIEKYDAPRSVIEWYAETERLLENFRIRSEVVREAWEE